MSEITIPLTREEQLTLKKGAFGAIQLLSQVNPGIVGQRAVKEATAGTMVLNGATGFVGHILGSKDKIRIKGNAAQVADEVLPALTATINTLKAKAPGEAEEFRTLVTTAVEQAARSSQHGQISPAQAHMISKITAALAAE